MKEKKREERKTKVQGFQVVEKECIWMKAGVVNFRLCDNAFDCNTCPFDLAMRKAMGEKAAESMTTGDTEWAQNLKKRFHGASRPCRHALTGRIQAPKICTMNYECHHCPYDQMLDDYDLAQIGGTPAYRSVSGFRMADGYYYHMGHTWARLEHGGRVRIGFDDFLVKVFGAPRGIQFPPLGSALKQDEVAWAFGRNGHQAAVLAPVTGTVLAVNHKGLEHPEITHHDPYHEGWLAIIEPDAPKKNLKRLYFGEESFRWMEADNRKLMSMLGPEYERLAATGGGVVEDVFGQFPKLGWENLIRNFLHTEAS
jgi:glycine cleavage system H lipoate-binding protein